MPTAGQLLDVWEQGRFQTPAQRAFALLALATPAVSSEKLAGYGIGQRDAELLSLREKIFGPRLTATARCPACGQEIEMDFSVSDLRAQAAEDAEKMRAMQIGDFNLQFRLPTCGDLLALSMDHRLERRPLAGESFSSTETRRQDAGGPLVLLQRCVAEARRNGEAIAVNLLPAETTAVLSRCMAELDPQGDIQLALTCPQCAHAWQSPLDVGSYLWTELYAWAERTLREVHTLAAAYGWREADILAMTPWRRQTYLELIRS